MEVALKANNGLSSIVSFYLSSQLSFSKGNNFFNIVQLLWNSSVYQMLESLDFRSYTLEGNGDCNYLAVITYLWEELKYVSTVILFPKIVFFPQHLSHCFTGNKYQLIFIVRNQNILYWFTFYLLLKLYSVPDVFWRQSSKE